MNVCGKICNACLFYCQVKGNCYSVALCISSSLLDVNAQRVLRGPDYVPKNRRILEHQEATRCLTVAEDYRIFLDKCNWEREEPLAAGIFSIIKSNSGGHLLRWSTGPKPEGIEGCLYAKPPVEESEDTKAAEEAKVILVECDPKNPALSWRFENIGTAKYFVRHFTDGKCLVPTSHEIGASFDTVTCDSEDAGHVWRICENISYRKCDI